jgi:hypothetical protein
MYTLANKTKLARTRAQHAGRKTAVEGQSEGQRAECVCYVVQKAPIPTQTLVGTDVTDHCGTTHYALRTEKEGTAGLITQAQASL